MTAEASPKRQLLWGLLMLLVVLFGLCTVFAAVVTAAQAWQESAETHWPQVTARVDTCGMQRVSTGQRRNLYLRCRLSYQVGDEQHATNIYSATFPPREDAQYPPNQMAPFEQWLNAHPAGTAVEVRYDPANDTKIVLLSDPMPRGGLRTQSNLKLLGFFCAGFVLLFFVARITKPPVA